MVSRYVLMTVTTTLVRIWKGLTQIRLYKSIIVLVSIIK